MLVKIANRASEKPIAFRLRIPNSSWGMPFDLIVCSVSMISRIWAKNHGSNLVISKISTSEKPKRIECAMTRMRSGD